MVQSVLSSAVSTVMGSHGSLLGAGELEVAPLLAGGAHLIDTWVELEVCERLAYGSQFSLLGAERGSCNCGCCCSTPGLLLSRRVVNHQVLMPSSVRASRTKHTPTLVKTSQQTTHACMQLPRPSVTFKGKGGVGGRNHSNRIHSS